MYLSRLILNLRNSQVRSELAHPYQMHKTLLRAFPTGGVHISRSEEESSGVLFRVDEDSRTQQPFIIVQSRIAPDWTLVDMQRDQRYQEYLLQPAKYKPIDWQFKAGQRLRFRLLANPTKKVKSESNPKNGKRVGLYSVREQVTWLQHKAEQHGFAVRSALPSCQQRSDDGTRQLKFLSVQFDGLLQVTDPERFLAAVQAGIGSGKAFGFGLLSLAPVSD